MSSTPPDVESRLTATEAATALRAMRMAVARQQAEALLRSSQRLEFSDVLDENVIQTLLVNLPYTPEGDLHTFGLSAMTSTWMWHRREESVNPPQTKDGDPGEQ